MFAFVIGLVVNIWMAIIQKALTRPKVSSAGAIDQPRTDEGTAIPAIFGTVQLAPNVVWWGDVEPVPIKGPRRVFGLAGPKDTIGYRYYAGMQGALCWGPIDELVEITVAEKYLLSEAGPSSDRVVSGGGYTTTTSDACTPALPISYVAAGQAITISAANLFGGKEVEGGLLGTLRFYFGSTTQGENSYLASQPDLPDDFPHYKGLCYAVWEHMYLGTLPYVKGWQFTVRRCPGALGVLASDTSLSRIGDDANPAEVIYDIWTNSRWGLGESATALDVPSFLTALQTLSDEGLGVSGVVGTTAEDSVADILRTVDGSLVEDPLTGKLRLKLVRADYNVDELEVFTPSNSSGFTTTRADWDTLASEVKVTYTDASQRFTTRTRAAYNGAVRQIVKASGVTVSYPLISTAANAEALAFRDLHAMSTPLASGSLTVARIGSTLAVGDPFIIHYEDRGLPTTVVRVTRANYGTLHGRETVELDWAQDVFGIPGGVYVGQGDDEWTPPDSTNDGIKFTVDADFELSDTQGCLTLEITGDVTAITLVETQTQKGGEAAGSWTTEDNSAPITVCVDRDDLETGFVAYRVSYTDSDGSTQLISDSFQVPPLLPEDALDPGVPSGTPSNFVYKFAAGDGVIIPASITGDPERIPEWNTSPAILNFSASKSVQIQCPVLKAGPSGAKVGIRGIRFAGDTPTYLAVSSNAPSVDVDSRNMIGDVLWANGGGFVDLDISMRIDNLNIEPVIAGHVGGETIVGDLTITALSVEASVPPTTETPTPELPGPTEGLYALWLLTEGSGQTVANKDVGGVTANLILGDNSSDGSRDPTWGSRLLATTGFFTVDHSYSHFDTCPSFVDGFALFFYAEIVSLGGLAKFFCGSTAGTVTDHQIYVDTDNKLHARVSENTGGGTTRTVNGTTTITNGVKGLVGIKRHGGTLKIYWNPVDGLHEGSTACGAPIEGTLPRNLIIGAGHTPTTGDNGFDSWKNGDIVLCIGANVANLTPAKIAEMYAAFKLVYTDLP